MILRNIPKTNQNILIDCYFLTTAASEGIDNTLHDKSFSKKNRNEGKRGQCYLNLYLSAIPELQNKTHFSLFTYTHMHMHI